MSSHFRKLVPMGALLALLCAHAAGATRELRVCAEPDNLPLSQRDGSGFENRIARLLADDMGAHLSYFWQELRRGFLRKTKGRCDVFMGVPAGFDRLLLTRPYYRSTYVAVYRSDGQPFTGFDPTVLKRERIGVQLIGDDLVASPPGYALTRAGAIDNVRGFTIYGDGPAGRRMVDAVATGRLDLALVWGPQAGYFAQRSEVPLTVAPASAPRGLPAPFDYAIAVGVRKGDSALRDRIDEILQRRRADIDAILAQYAVPRVDLAAATPGGRP